MSQFRGRILVVDDDRSMCELLQAGLTALGFNVTIRTTAAEVSARMGEEDYDAIVTDLNMPGLNGIELCERIAANRPDVPVIVVTAFGSLHTAIQAIRAGAYDFITKPFDIDALALALDRATRHKALQEEVKRLRQEAMAPARFPELLGESEAMRELRELVARVADTESTVLVTGETGTGKELVARALHRASRRAQGPFVAVNCAAMPEALLESELFGHARGAFTDARTERKGLFQRCEGGTLLLDEIGDMPLGLQPKLLRALQDRTLRPVGSDDEIKFDVRIVVSTNVDLEDAVEQGRFREDLFFRLNVIPVSVPPLRARGNDVLLLAQNFATRFATRSQKRVRGLSGTAAEKLMSYSWPGNVRELENAMERAVALTRFEEIAVDDLPERVRNYSPSHIVIAADSPSELATLETVERAYILRVFESAGRNKAQAARILGLDRKTLYRKLQRYGAVEGEGDAQDV